MNNPIKIVKIAIIGTSLAALASLTSCCGTSPDPGPQPTPPVYVEPSK
jgi:hypothetical protein